MSVTTSLFNMTYLHTIFPADTHPAEWQLLREEPTANRGESEKYKKEREC
jgi:hypothetical protein